MDADTSEFEIGLALAGAVSAGAYTAGVVDFFVEALDAYEVARQTGRTPEGEVWTGPTHRVRVPVTAGASAGGMTAAMTAIQINADFEHLGEGRTLSVPARNRLYASWVDEIDINHLLETRDLDGSGALRSVLCCNVLDEIVARTIAVRPSVQRAWIGRGDSHALAVLLTVSNLGGVPYRFQVTSALAGDAYSMLNHGDDLRFLVGPAPTTLPDHQGFEILDLSNPNSEVLGRFGAAALATGAFPIGLAARAQTRPFADYDRGDRVGFDKVLPDGNIQFVPALPIPSGQTGRHRFVAVDGGVIDNEPFELARRFLSRQAEPNPQNRNGRDTRYAVVLIDPFPNREGWPPEDSSDLLSKVALALLSMLIDQARFKPQELSLALDETVFSRFAILPEPVKKTAASLRLPIASGALGGFSGFLHRSFRHHDYCLGRRNAQAFLRYHFCLPETNGLYDVWKAKGGDVAEWSVPEPGTAAGQANPTTVLDAVPTSERPTPPRVRALPIIPLTQRLQREIKLGREDMPQPEKIRSDLNSLLSTRFSRVVERLVDTDLAPFVPFGIAGRTALKFFLPGVLTNKASDVISSAKQQIKAAFPDG
jgi:hypothetical protein